MQLMRLANVPPEPPTRIFRYSQFRAVIGATILIAFALAASLLGWYQDIGLAYYLAAISVVSLLIFHKLIIARFRPSNWLVRMTDHGLLIKFRSYLNDHFDDQDLTVVFLPYSEIRSARYLKEHQEVPDRDGNRRKTTTRTRRVVEVEIAADSTQLGKALARERERLFSKAVIGAGRISTRYQHLPVQLASRSILRVEWGVVPSAQVLLDALSRHTLVQNPAAVSKDFTNLDKLSKEEQETRLVELAASGDMMGAVTLARELYAWDLTAAKQFVEELMRKQATSGQ